MTSFPRTLAKALAGNADDVGRLLKSQLDRVTALARDQLRGTLREKLRTSDLVQSAFLQVLRDLPTFRGGSEREFSRWVTTILLNRARYRRRFFLAQRRASISGFERKTTPDPLDLTCRAEDLDRLNLALTLLPSDYREILELRQQQRWSHEKLASVLKRTPGACRALLMRARTALAIELERLEASQRPCVKPPLGRSSAL